MIIANHTIGSSGAVKSSRSLLIGRDVNAVPRRQLSQSPFHGEPDSPVRVVFSEEANVCRELFGDRLRAWFVAEKVSPKHDGVASKLMTHAVRLAFIRRCLRWSVGEFGLSGPVGPVTAEDFEAASKVVLFSLRRLVPWVSDFFEQTVDDLASSIVRFMDARGLPAITVRELQQSKFQADLKAADLRAACQGLVAAGRGRWTENGKLFCLNEGEPNSPTVQP